jgi:hypothetical protein
LNPPNPSSSRSRKSKKQGKGSREGANGPKAAAETSNVSVAKTNESNSSDHAAISRVQISELHGALPCDFGGDQSPFANGLQYAESNTYNQVEPAALEHKPLRCDHAALSHDCLSFPRYAAQRSSYSFS